jgi:hypothetical protein
MNAVPGVKFERFETEAGQSSWDSLTAGQPAMRYTRFAIRSLLGRDFDPEPLLQSAGEEVAALWGCNRSS